MNFTKDDMMNIKKCIKKKGTKSQRDALTRWENTVGYMLITEQYNELQQFNIREISRLQTNKRYTELFIRRHGLTDEFEKEKKEYFEKCSYVI